MTQDDLKKLDKKMRQIQDPFGTGFQMLIRLWKIAPKMMESLCAKLAASIRRGR